MEQQHHQGFCSFSPTQSADRTGVSSGQPMMRLSITSTTGNPVELTVPRGETAEGLKMRISQQLKVQTERIVLLHRNRHLVVGKLLEQGVTDGSKLTLVPVIESGLACSTARERTIRDELESLTEVQINDFLLGRSPLTVSIGTGAPMMHVQLQLSAQQDVKELKQDRDSNSLSSCQHGPLTPGTVNHLNSASSGSSTGSATSFSSEAQLSPDSSSFVQCHTQKPRSSLHSSSYVPPVTCQNPSFVDHVHKPSSPSGLPHCSSPIPANTPVWLGRPSGSSPRPPSPATASTFSETDAMAKQSKQPGAVIESFVSHSPDVFSGTFSGTLARSRQNGVSNHRHGISIILQILQDLLRAAYHHQGAPTSPSPNCCSSSNHEASNVTAEEQCKARTTPPLTQATEHNAGKESRVLHSFTAENKALHYKLEHLQLLMHRSRQRRRTRRSSHLYQTARPNQHHHYWS